MKRLLAFLFMVLLLAGTLPAQATLYPITNFGVVTASTGYTSAATTIVLTAGHGAKLPSTFPFILVWFDSTTYAGPHLDPNVEIIEVSNRSTDTLTIVRGKEGTSAVNHNTADKTYTLYVTLTKAMYDRIGSDIAAASSTIPNVEDCSAHASCNAAVTAIGAVNLRTLRVTSSQVVGSNLTVTPNISTWFIGAGQLSINSSVTVTFDRPDQLMADKHKQIFTGAGAPTGVTFSKPGTVYPQWWGAVCDGSTDDGPEIQSALDSLPAAGGVVELHGGTCKSNQELSVTKSDVTIRLDPGTTLNLSSIAGTGTANVHVSSTVIAGLKITGPRVRIVGGRITGSATVSSKKVIGIHIHGASQTKIGGTKIDGLHAGIWMGGGAVEPTVQNVELDANEEGLICGYQPATSTSPQVTNAAVRNIQSHGATVGDGLSLYSYCDGMQVFGGRYYSNAGYGIDGYVGGATFTGVGFDAYSNAAGGARFSYNTLSGTSAGKLGFSRRLTLTSAHTNNNTGDGLVIKLEDYSLFSTIGGVEDVSIVDHESSGNGGDGFDLGLVRSSVVGSRALLNTGNGFTIRSNKSASYTANQSWDNGSADSNMRGFEFLTADTTGGTPPNSTLITFNGNHAGDTRSGGSRTTNFAFDLLRLASGEVTDNNGSNANTADWKNINSLSAVSFTNNRGTVSGSDVLGTPWEKRLYGSKTWDPASLAQFTETSTTLTVTGAAVGDIASCGQTTITADLLQLNCYVSAADTVRVVLRNLSTSTVDVTSGTLNAEVMKK
jgi:hypothetical protein